MHTHPQITFDRLERVLREHVLPRVHTPLAGVDAHSWDAARVGEDATGARLDAHSWNAARTGEKATEAGLDAYPHETVGAGGTAAGTGETAARTREAGGAGEAAAPAGRVVVHAWEARGDGEPVPASHVLGLEESPGYDTPVWTPFEVGSEWAPAWRTTWFRLDGRIPSATAVTADTANAGATARGARTAGAVGPRPDGDGDQGDPTEASDRGEFAGGPDHGDPSGTSDSDGGIVELLLDLGWEDHSVGGHCEGLVYRPDGTVVKGLHPRNGWVRLTGPGASPGVVRADGTFTLYVEAAANPLVLGLPPFVVTDLGEKDARSFQPYRLRRAELCDFHAATWELIRDLEVAAGLAAEIPETEPRYWRLVRAVDHALDTLDPYDVRGTAAAARAALEPVLAQPAHASAHRLSAVGHAHIDSAWLWPVRETERKVARTVANVLHLMDADPRLVYAMSSAQQYAWLEENHPDLFERVRERVGEGRFVPVGGMWVESDAVMPTGESIVRQFTHGKRYFMDRFGIEPREVWLPDSFGYSGALPQLARRAGFRWFLTQKISWNDTNPFPHHSFLWEGIDGTRIFTHFPPADTYAAELTAEELRHAVTNFRDKAVSSHSLIPFGYGDGGGGPTREMLARAARFTDLEGAPRVDVRPPAGFFADAETELVAAGDPAVWLGELYLELHRGTLTSQIAMKQGNRRAEAMLRTAEYLATAATVKAGAPYPADELTEIWETVLLNQFHDILPGSSISWVHREARATYRRIDERLRAVVADAVKALDDGTTRPGRLVPVTRGAASAPAGTAALTTPGIATPAGAGETTTEPDAATLAGSGVQAAAPAAAGQATSWVVRRSGDLADAPPVVVTGVGGTTVGQAADDGEPAEETTVNAAATGETADDDTAAGGGPTAGGGTAVGQAAGDGDGRAAAGDGAGGVVLDNGLVRVVVDGTGHVPSMRDLVADREVVPAGQRLGVVQLFRDVPVRWDAWDIDRHTFGLGRDLDGLDSITTVTDDDGTARVVVGRSFGASHLRLAYALAPGARRLDMEAEIDWHERDHLLKVCLPVAVRTATARFETQYGYVERAIHRNTSWDEARYESCTHRYVHLAEPGYGVGVVNDSTYGADVSRLPVSSDAVGGAAGGTLVRLSLLRAPRFPDPETDQGRHRMRWSVVCAPDPADTVLAAYDLNAPELDAVPDVGPLVRLEPTTGLAVVDWVKLADDGTGDLVVRVYEALGGRAAGRLLFCDEIGHDATVVETDLLERVADDPELPAAWHDGRLDLGPFQVATVRIRRPSARPSDPDLPPHTRGVTRDEKNDPAGIHAEPAPSARRTLRRGLDGSAAHRLWHRRR